MEKYTINIDWLQICGLCYNIQQGKIKGQLMTYDIVLSSIETSMFKELYHIKHNGLIIATMQANPRPTSLNKNLVLLKLENRVLYCSEYIKILYDIMNVLKIRYKGITRLDLCYDCNYFRGHRKPSKFVHDYVFKSAEEKGYICRKGSESFQIHGSKQNTTSSKITSISYGSNNSHVRQYMYDKTIELQEVKDKPWIRQRWEENGLLNDKDNHVWRTEISIKSQGVDILNLDTGQIFKLHPDYLQHYEQIEKLFMFYAEKYLCFSRKGDQVKKRNYPRLYLFEYDKDKCNCMPRNISLCHDTGRMEKICVNKLVKLQQQYIDLSEQERHGLYTAELFLRTLAGIKSSRDKASKQEQYLDTLRGYSSIKSEELAYFKVLEEALKSKRELSSVYLYNEYLQALEQEENR